MSPKNIHINRDLENDILYVFRSENGPYPTKNIDLDADVVARFDPKKGEYVGLIIDDFSRVFSYAVTFNEWQLMEMFDQILTYINSAQHLQPTR